MEPDAARLEAVASACDSFAPPPGGGGSVSEGPPPSPSPSRHFIAPGPERASADRDAADSEVHSWLRSLGLGQYASTAVALGYDSVGLILALDSEMLAQMTSALQMPPGHAARLVIATREAEAEAEAEAGAGAGAPCEARSGAGAGGARGSQCGHGEGASLRRRRRWRPPGRCDSRGADGGARCGVRSGARS